MREKYNVVIGIYRQPMDTNVAKEESINRILRKLQEELQEDFAGRDAEIAFVFTEGIYGVCDARGFYKMDSNFYYTDYVNKTAPLSSIWNMGMAILEQKEKEDEENGFESNNRFYFLTDHWFGTAECQRSQAVMRSDRFANRNFDICLVKTDENCGNAAFESYIEDELKGSICLE